MPLDEAVATLGSRLSVSCHDINTLVLPATHDCHVNSATAQVAASFFWASSTSSLQLHFHRLGACAQRGAAMVILPLSWHFTGMVSGQSHTGPLGHPEVVVEGTLSAMDFFDQGV